MEPLLLRWVADFRAITAEAKAAMEAWRDAAPGFKAANDLAATREVAQHLGERVGPVAERWLALSNDFAATLADVRVAVLVLVERVCAGGLQPWEQTEASEAFDGLVGLIALTRATRGLSEYADAAWAKVPVGLGEDVPWVQRLVRSSEAITAAVRQVEAAHAVLDDCERLISSLPGRS